MSGASRPVLLGYAEPLSVAPGQDIALHVSALEPYEVAVLRLRHGSDDPRGPGVRSTLVESLGQRPRREQGLPAGSYVRVPARPVLDTPAFTVTAWVRPTLEPDGRPRALVARRNGAAGWALGLDGDGRLAFWAGGQAEPVVSTDRPLAVNAWTFVAASAGPDGVRLAQLPVPEWPVGSWRATAETDAAPDLTGADDLLIGAWFAGEARTAHFTGLVDRPAMYEGTLPAHDLLGAATDGVDLPVLARWRPGQQAGSRTVPDAGPHGLDGMAEHSPARGVPGANWTGREVDFRQAPDEFDAVHLHDDDLTDAGWSAEVTWRVPDELRSGVYAFRVRAAGEELQVAFYVRRRPHDAAAPVAVLIPTFTYLAYANSHRGAENGRMTQRGYELGPRHAWAAQHKLCSLYDVHRDGSGAYYASRRRPLTTVTPDYIGPFGAWNLSADLSLIDWLETEGVEYDVLCDEDLHAGGADVLADYQVVLTGTHPEYVTEPMLDAHEAFLAAGGRLMYLGANGYYWVTGVASEEPHVIEIRRGHTGTRVWEVPPGETHLSTTGEPGGLWRHRGRAPQRHVGIGFAAQGGRGTGRPYEPSPPQSDGRGAFALDGVSGPIEVDGLVSHSAAGMEIDRADHALGTPPHTVLLATARNFSDYFQHCIEEVLTSHSQEGGTVDPLVRADMVFFEGPHGGAVFSTGSIAWCTALPINGYDNPVSVVTRNVLRRFLDPQPFVPADADGSPQR